VGFVVQEAGCRHFLWWTAMLCAFCTALHTSHRIGCTGFPAPLIEDAKVRANSGESRRE